MRTSLCILYATNTYDPEGIVKSVASTADRQRENPEHGYHLELHALEGQVLLIASSDAQGESSAIAERFHNWLRKKTSPLSGVRYSIYASATSNRDFYAFAKTLDAEFKQLGAIQVLKHLEREWPSDHNTENRAWFDATFPNDLEIETAAVA